MAHEYQTKSRLIARVLRDILASERFENLADMTDVLKTRLAKLKIHVTPADLSEAYAMVESNRSLVPLPKTIHAIRRGRERLFDTPSIHRDEAAKTYASLMTRYRSEKIR
jgi:hypothetical protein